MIKHKLSRRSKNNLSGCEDDAKLIVNRALQLSLIDFGIPNDGGLRTDARQHEIHLSGASPFCDGYKVRSIHQANENGKSEAWDVYAYVGKASWDEEHLAIIAVAMFAAAMEIGREIEWGGNWQRKKPKLKNGIPYGWDMAHFQLKQEK